MDAWIDRPPEPAAFAGVRLIRVPAGRTIEGIITSPSLVGCNTHYYHRHTIPCEGPSCDACREGIPARWHGYVSLWQSASHTQHALELTALAATPIIAYQDRHGTLRGATLKATRTGNRPNSPVQTIISPTDVDLRKLPAAVKLRQFLAVLWSLAPSNIAADSTDATLDALADLPEPIADLTAGPDPRPRDSLLAAFYATKRSNGDNASQ